MKRIILGYWLIERYIRRHIRVSRFVYFHVPLIGRPLSLALDRMLLICYGIDLMSSSIDVKALSISHPGGILLGGNGIVSASRSGDQSEQRDRGSGRYLRQRNDWRDVIGEQIHSRARGLRRDPGEEGGGHRIGRMGSAS